MFWLSFVVTDQGDQELVPDPAPGIEGGEVRIVEAGNVTFEPEHDKTNKMTCALSKDSD